MADAQRDLPDAGRIELGGRSVGKHSMEALSRGRQAGALERLAGREPRHRPVSGGRHDGAQRDLVDDVEPGALGCGRRLKGRHGERRHGERRKRAAPGPAVGDRVEQVVGRRRSDPAHADAREQCRIVRVGQLGHDDVQALVLQRDPQVEQRGAARERELAVQWALDPHDDVGVLDLETPRRVWRCRAPCARHRPGDRLGDRRFDVKGVSAHAPHARRRRVTCHPERTVTDRGGLRTPFRRVMGDHVPMTESDQAPDEVRRVTLVLADDHAVVRSGLRLLLEAEPGHEVLAEASTAEDALRYVRAHRPSVLVLDLNMPGRPSLEVIPEIREATPQTGVVVLTMQEDPAFAREALRAGALGYVLKEAADEELLQAVRLAAVGETYLNPRLGARLAAEPAAPAGLPDDLTEREVEVLRLIALGHTNTEIAAQLYLSVRTIESHRAHIQHKIRRTSRAELVQYALEHGFVDVGHA